MLTKIFFLLFSSAVLAQDLNYFPQNYQEARARFLEYGSKISNSDASEILIGKEQLSVNLLYLKPLKKLKSLVILTSGTHGPEAYFGSALQFLFLKEILPTLDRTQTGYILVHSLNPWGFKYHRRGTENNVNLNRNFDTTKKIFQLKNQGYESVKNFLEITQSVESTYAFSVLKILWEMFSNPKVSRQSLTEAIGKGQYESAKGINFGGFDFEPQTIAVTEYLKNHIQGYSSILNIDLHTGLGDRGVLHLMTKEDMNEVSKLKLKQMLNFPEDKTYYQETLPHAEGFYEIYGDYANILRQLTSQEQQVIIPVTAEFGTMGNGLLGKIKTINRLILENQGFYFGFKSKAIEEQVKKDYLELFYPSDLEWRKKALIDGKYLLDVVLRRFIAL